MTFTQFKQLPKPMCKICSIALSPTTCFNQAEIKCAIGRMRHQLKEAKQRVGFPCQCNPNFNLITGPSLPCNPIQMTIKFPSSKMTRMKTECNNCFHKKCPLSWTMSKCEGPTTLTILSTNIMAVPVRSTMPTQARLKRWLWINSSIRLVICVYQKPGQSSRHVWSFYLGFLCITFQQDWPPEDDFQTEFWELFMAFINAVPFPSTMSLKGACNLAAHFPTNAVPPDLGMWC